MRRRRQTIPVSILDVAIPDPEKDHRVLILTDEIDLLLSNISSAMRNLQAVVFRRRFLTIVLPLPQAG